MHQAKAIIVYYGLNVADLDRDQLPVDHPHNHFGHHHQDVLDIHGIILTDAGTGGDDQIEGGSKHAGATS